MKKKRHISVAVALALGVAATVLAITYEEYTDITDVNITGTLSDGASVPIDTEYTMQCSTSTDTDKYCDANGLHYPDDPVTHTWSGAGTFDPTTGTSVTWTSPSSTGDKTITVTADDSPLADETEKTDSITVTVVKVDEIQYNDPNTGWTDAGTLYVHLGTAVQFKAIPDPCDASWPSGKPVWGGTSGASGTGSTTSVTFNLLSTSTTDYKTVTAECGNTVTVNVVVYDFTGVLTPNENFTGRSMNQYGVEETVALSHTTDPNGITGLPLEWEKKNGVGSVSGSTYDAEAIAGAVTLRLELQSGPSQGRGKDYAKTVVAPSNRFIRHRTLTGAWHKKGQHSVQFKGESFLDPKEVSFTNIQRREGASTAATGTGLFAPVNGYVHPVGNWYTPSDPNVTTGCYVVADTTGFDFGPGGVLGEEGTFSGYFIDYEYKGDDAVVRNMGNIESAKTVEAAGNSKAKKGTVPWVSKHLNDDDSTY